MAQALRDSGAGPVGGRPFFVGVETKGGILRWGKWRRIYPRYHAASRHPPCDTLSTTPCSAFSFPTAFPTACLLPHYRFGKHVVDT